MTMNNTAKKYRRQKPLVLKDRTWPDKEITQAPRWCAVDLRDGNQALAIPMDVDRKLRLFKLLVEVGFKDIEIGFPSASQTEFEFARTLIEEKLIPDDVRIQVLCQARQHLVDRTFEALEGAKNVIFHLYASTSPAQRRYTFNMEKEDVTRMTLQGIDMVKKGAEAFWSTGKSFTLEYSPESFSQTEPEYAAELCQAVIAAWQPDAQRQLILNLPSTVEVYHPGVFADVIEWMHRKLCCHEGVTISLHTHNDRGTGQAATELAMLAGAGRVEGCLFGNGERTGNLDLVTAALNLFAEGIDPGLDFSNLPHVTKVYEECTGMSVHQRHPYAGELVFTAFSGSHQDAIRKALKIRDEGKARNPAGADVLVWDIPYLPIDPADIGRTYESIIRINSQSGKGGVAWTLEQRLGITIPRSMEMAVGKSIGTHADHLGRELTPDEVVDQFRHEFLYQGRSDCSINLVELTEKSTSGTSDTQSTTTLEVVLSVAEKSGARKELKLARQASGPVDAFMHILKDAGLVTADVKDYHEQSTGSGSDSTAAAFVCLEVAGKGQFWGLGMDRNITSAALKAILKAVNQSR